MPTRLTEYALERIAVKDKAFARFADVFHHRMLCLFYRAWAQAQPVVHYDRHAKKREEDRFSHYLGSLFGLGMYREHDRDAMPNQAKLLFAGHLSCQTRYTEGLEIIVSKFFGVPVRLDEFIGEWLQIAPHEQTRLSGNNEANCLGVGTVLGAKVFDCQHKIRIVLGPLDMAFYEAMLPVTEKYKAFYKKLMSEEKHKNLYTNLFTESKEYSLKELIAIIRNYLGDEFVWDINLILRQKDVPQLRLERMGKSQLGWSTWLGRKNTDADDLTLKSSLRL